MSETITTLLISLIISSYVLMFLGITSEKDKITNCGLDILIASLVLLFAVMCFPINVEERNYTAKVVVGNQEVYNGKISKYSTSKFSTTIWTEDGRKITGGKNDIVIIEN